MVLTDVFWKDLIFGRDIHLIDGDSVSLSDKIILKTANSSDPAHSPPTNVTVEYFPRFKGAPSAHGISVTRNGFVTVASPNPSLHNFIVRVLITDNNADAVKSDWNIYIRIHIHKTITKVWLSPSTLTIHERDVTMPALKGPRFSVLALFDDGIIGDISLMPNITWRKISGDIGFIEFEPIGNGNIVANNSTGQVSIQAKLPLNPPYNGIESQPATVKLIPRWSIPKPVTLVRGSFSRMANSQNILFIAEGFKGRDEGKFGQAILDLVLYFNNKEGTCPLNHLRKSFNYWMCFQPSEQQDLSVLHDMMLDQSNDPAKQFGLRNVPYPTPTFGDDGIWTLRQLIFEVGLPIPSESDPSANNFTTMKEKWKALFRDDIEDHVNDALYTQWQDLSSRFIVNEKDTAFGLAMGDRANLTHHDPDRFIDFHHFRYTRDHLNQFLSQLTYKGHVVGDTWVHGKDKALVFFVCSGPFPSGSSKRTLTALTIETIEFVQLNKSTSNPGTDVKERELPTIYLPRIGGNVAHELLHNLSLKDEYAEMGKLILTDLSSVAKKELQLAGNVQLEEEILVGGAPASIDGNKIKWRWPRIKKAGVLANDPTEVNGLIKINMIPGHVSLFKKGDFVMIRGRPLIEDTRRSEKFKVNEVLKASNQIILKSVKSDVGMHPARDFKSGSILFEYHPSDSTDPLSDELLIIAPAVLNLILAQKRSLDMPTNTHQPCDPNIPGRNDKSKQSPILPPGLLASKPADESQIMGLYRGGARYYCGVYHPSGTCNYRHDDYLNVVQFCHVCRYFIVDNLDPTKHQTIDKHYKEIYPK